MFQLAQNFLNSCDTIVAMDIFTIKSRNYLVTVDYYSQFFEVDFVEHEIGECDPRAES